MKTIKVSLQVYRAIEHRMKARETFDAALRRLLRIRTKPEKEGEDKTNGD